MALTNLTPLLADARRRRYAIPAFDVSNDEMVRAVAQVCEEERSPAIFMLLKADLVAPGPYMLADMIACAARDLTVPVCIHLDHATSLIDIERAIDAGATSVMFDGSMLPYEENVAGTRAVVALSHARGVSVEAELGHVADAIGGLSETGAPGAPGESEASLTDPDDVRRFAAETGVDCLAVSIGTAHGVYISAPKLHFDRLRRIEAASPCPLVLHGGSGTPEAEMQKAIHLGITKVNIYSEVLCAMNTGLRDRLNQISNLSAWPSVVWSAARAGMRDVIRAKIRAFGAAGRA